ncbi:MAG: hypothetical protein HGB11_09590, partial [Chlorobiales bacterium]|nr:hypothetical protein [Chlorobiales bacterium]
MLNQKKLGLFIALIAIFVMAFSIPSSYGSERSYYSYPKKSISDSLQKDIESPQTIQRVAQVTSSRIEEEQANKQKLWIEFKQSLSLDKEGLDSLRLTLISEKEAALTDTLAFISKRYQQTLVRHLESALAPSSTEPLNRFQAACQGLLSKHSEELDKKIPALQDSLYTFTVMLHVRQLEDSLLATDRKFSPSDNMKWLLSSVMAARPEWSFTTSYSTRTVWQGLDQNDGEGSYSITAGYDHATGISASVSFMGLVGQEIVFDRTALMLAYQTEFFKKLSVTGSYSRYFYSDDSPQLTSSITDELSLLAAYVNPILTPAISVSYAFAGDGNDVFASLAVDHSFWFDDFFGCVLQIDPTIRADYGTLESVINQYALKINRVIGTRLSKDALSSASSSSF